MAEALAKEGIDLVHIIGPDTGHAYHPEAKVEIERPHGRPRRARPRSGAPTRSRFITYTLQVQPAGLGARSTAWASTGSAARVDGELRGPDDVVG